MGERNDTDILVGAYKGKYLWYTAPILYHLAQEPAQVKVPPLVSQSSGQKTLSDCVRSKTGIVEITSKVREILLGNKVYLLDPLTVKHTSLIPFSILI